MKRRVFLCAIVLPAVCAVNMGCMPKMTIEEMKQHMPQRPAELDRLNDFAGTWEWEGVSTMAMLDKPIKNSGTSVGEWSGDGWFLVSKAVFRMEGLDPMHGMETWMYDTKSKKYRSTWVDSMGSIGTGEARFNEKTQTWHMSAKSRGPHGKMTMKGTAKLIDADTMEWTWSEYAMGGLMKTMEMTGTSRRKQ